MNRSLKFPTTTRISSTEAVRLSSGFVDIAAGKRVSRRLGLACLCVALTSGHANAGTNPLTIDVQETPAAAPATSVAAKDEVIDLLAGDFNSTWQIFSSDVTKEPASIWKLLPDAPETDRVLVCSGNPKGFVFTTAEFTNFELTLEWKYPEDPSGNSGILIYTQNEPRIWPTAIQIQLHQPKAGSVFPSGDAKTDNTLDAAPDLARPVNVWNECRITSRDGRITVEINGKRAGEVTGAKPASGRIALQSEGSVVQFRRVRVKNLLPEPKPSISPEPAADADKPVPALECGPT